jgi:flagellar hook-associated protein 2
MNTAPLRSGQITFAGLGTGTDFTAMIDKLIQVERTRILRLEAQKTEWANKKTALQDLNTKLLNLRTSLEQINTMNRFLVKTADSVNTAVLTATASDQARVGTHVIEVNQLAQNHVLTGTFGFASSTTDITGGMARVFAYSYRGVTRTLNVPSGTTLEGLVNLINTDPQNPGMRAGIIRVADGNFRLQLRGLDLGAGNTVAVAPATTVPNLAPANFETTQAAQNARLRLDGFPAPPAFIERSSNTIADLIEGVTISLRSTGTTTLNIAVSNEAIRNNVREFVNQVNRVQARINELTQVREGRGSILTGNYGIRAIESRLNSILATRGLGFDINNDVFSSLSMIGITTDANQGSPTFGLLRLNEAVLDQALRNRPNELAQIFAADYIGSTNSPHFRYHSRVSGITRGGVYDIAYTVSAGQVTTASINGRPASISDGNRITGTHGNPEAGLTIMVGNLAAGTYTGQVFLRVGKAGELAYALGDLTHISTGPLNIMRNNYREIMNSIDRNIEFEQRRISQLEKDMRNRFARLEALLGYYDSLGRSINAQLAQFGAHTRR